MTFNEKYKSNALLLHTFEFSLRIISYSEELTNQKKYILSNQLLRSATSIGANCKEAQNAESKADFIHKLKVAMKEADETEYWLFLCDAHPNYPDCTNHLNDLSGIIKLLNKIIATSKRKNTA